MTSSTITFDVTEFRADYPEFASSVTYPDDLLQSYWDMATCYVSDANYGSLADDCRQQAIDLMTAHLLKIAQLASANQVATQIQNATIDKITDGFTPPPLPNQWQWWLGTTVYGQQLLALLQAKAVGGFSVGGWPELSAFRKAWGVF